MRIERIVTKQAHPVPKQAYSPTRRGNGSDHRADNLDSGFSRGGIAPLDFDILQQPKVVVDYVPQPDGGEVEMPLGSTSQNNFQEVNWYRCNVCDVVAPEATISDHYHCGEDSDDNNS